ncbi:MAG: hypothetical protein GF364_05025 [Candidatus Lokiarchaeota archaeon]|nr:hypothetical protein [Candidatus Lokiarchaeota archaeon]
MVVTNIDKEMKKIFSSFDQIIVEDYLNEYIKSAKEVRQKEEEKMCCEKCKVLEDALRQVVREWIHDIYLEGIVEFCAKCHIGLWRANNIKTKYIAILAGLKIGETYLTTEVKEKMKDVEEQMVQNYIDNQKMKDKVEHWIMEGE